MSTLYVTQPMLCISTNIAISTSECYLQLIQKKNNRVAKKIITKTWLNIIVQQITLPSWIHNGRPQTYSPNHENMNFSKHFGKQRFDINNTKHALGCSISQTLVFAPYHEWGTNLTPSQYISPNLNWTSDYLTSNEVPTFFIDFY